MLRYTLALLAILALPTFAWSAPLAYNSKLRTTVEVKPLDDPANPYKDQYQDWDRWLIANAQPPDSWPTEDRFASYYVLEGRVDANGWLVPLLAEQRLWCEWNKDCSFNPFKSTLVFEIDGAGHMDDDLLRSTRMAMDRVRAPFYPAVPPWLAQSAPEWSLIIPDGRVVVKGFTRAERGDEWYVPGLMDWHISDEDRYPWQLRSPTGDVLATSLPNSYWWELTIPNFRLLIAPYSSRYLNVVHRYGHIHVYDMDGEHGGSLANFDWDGTPLQANLPLHDGRDGNQFLGIHGFDLPVIYAAQQELRLKAGD